MELRVWTPLIPCEELSSLSTHAFCFTKELFFISSFLFVLREKVSLLSKAKSSIKALHLIHSHLPRTWLHKQLPVFFHIIKWCLSWPFLVCKHLCTLLLTAGSPNLARRGLLFKALCQPFSLFMWRGGSSFVSTSLSLQNIAQKTDCLHSE